MGAPIDPADVITVWQGAEPHGSVHLPNGGASCAAIGCVAATAAVLRRACRPDLARWSVKDVLMHLAATPGAFVDSRGVAGVPGAYRLNWAVAAPALGLACGPALVNAPDHDDFLHEFAGHMVDSNADLAGELVKALMDGGAAVRVDVDGDGKGDHTIAGVLRADDEFLCSDPALNAIVRLDANLEAPTIRWNGRPHPYRVVGVRPIWSAA